ncbi:MAG: zf-HC2 domain-containing protein [Chloroflexota bacterium]|nr:zf-HC2 domain-containing protein [Chloroflexota bacterium]
MACLSDGRLRAFLDDELTPDQRARVVAHLDHCERCTRRLAELEAAAEIAAGAFSRVAPDEVPHMEPTLARQRAATGAPIAVRNTGANPFIVWRERVMRNRKVWYSFAAGVAALLLVVGLFSFAPTRAVARQFLSLFRVQDFAVVEVDPDEALMGEASALFEKEVLAQEPELIRDEPSVQVNSLEEAREAAGFAVRMPAYFPGEDDPIMEIKGATEMRMEVEAEGLALLLELAGMDPDLVPQELEGDIHALAPAVVSIRNDHFQVIQVWKPTIEYPEGLKAEVMGEAGLRLLGVPAAKAKRIAKEIDWSNTMLLPVPTNLAEIQETEIAGAKAVYLRPTREADQSAALLFQKEGVVYMVAGSGSLQSLSDIAASMF